MRDAELCPETLLDRAPASFVILGQADRCHAILRHRLQMTKPARAVTIALITDAS